MFNCAPGEQKSRHKIFIKAPVMSTAGLLSCSLLKGKWTWYFGKDEEEGAVKLCSFSGLRRVQHHRDNARTCRQASESSLELMRRVRIVSDGEVQSDLLVSTEYFGELSEGWTYAWNVLVRYLKVDGSITLR